MKPLGSRRIARRLGAFHPMRCARRGRHAEAGWACAERGGKGELVNHSALIVWYHDPDFGLGVLARPHHDRISHWESATPAVPGQSQPFTALWRSALNNIVCIRPRSVRRRHGCENRPRIGAGSSHVGPRHGPTCTFFRGKDGHSRLPRTAGITRLEGPRLWHRRADLGLDLLLSVRISDNVVRPNSFSIIARALSRRWCSGQSCM